MTKIIDLPTTTSTDVNTFVPVYQNGKTKKVSATAFGGGGSGSLSADFTSLSTVSSVDGAEVIAVNKPLGTALRTTVQNILNWILAKANTWTAKQTFNEDVTVSGAVKFSVQNSTIAGGAPASSGSSPDPNAVMRLQTGSVVFDSGVYGPGDFWLQARLVTNYATNFPLRLNPNGGAVLMSPSGFGYGSGAGATATQSTSKTTAVTLNKISGQITMSASSLASGASATFQFNNSFLSNADHVILTLRDDFSPANYSLRASAGSGVARISVSNISTSSLAEAVVFNFTVIKGSTT